MLLEFILVLGLRQQDTLLPQSNDLKIYDEYTTSMRCVDWTAVRSSRADANKAGFGSIATLQSDGSYELNFVFKGNETTTSSQLKRLNETLSTSLTFVKPIIKTQREKAFIEENVASSESKTGYQINVSTDFKKTLIPTDPSQTEELNELATAEEVVINVSLVKPIQNLNIQQEVEAPVLQKNKGSERTKDQLKTATTIPESKQATQSSEKEKRELRNSNDPLYAIIFGSFKKSDNAVKFASSLENEKIEIFQSNSLYRVGVSYEYYPASELREIKTAFPKVWLLRNDL